MSEFKLFLEREQGALKTADLTRFLISLHDQTAEQLRDQEFDEEELDELEAYADLINRNVLSVEDYFYSGYCRQDDEEFVDVYDCAVRLREAMRDLGNMEDKIREIIANMSKCQISHMPANEIDQHSNSINDEENPTSLLDMSRIEWNNVDRYSYLFYDMDDDVENAVI